jgi:hypothetical protein
MAILSFRTAMGAATINRSVRPGPSMIGPENRLTVRNSIEAM